MLTRLSVSLGMLALLSACATQQYDIANTQGASASFNENQTFWLGGIGQEVQINGAQACG